MFGNIGPLEIGIVLLIALVVFGPKRLPELGNSLGRGMREFKETISGDRDDEDEKADREVKELSASATTSESAEPASESAEPEVAAAERD